jgi:UDP-N-acetylmuramoyl-tripeptide--D-alanyl-D-alanine ligase
MGGVIETKYEAAQPHRRRTRISWPYDRKASREQRRSCRSLQMHLTGQRFTGTRVFVESKCFLAGRARRLRSEIIGTLKLRLRMLAAWVWRRCLWRTTFIAVTGSVGKTTTKNLIATALSQDGPVSSTLGNWQGYESGGSAAAVLATRWRHRYAVIEMGIERPGELRQLVGMVKPHVAIVLDVKKCHTMMFPTVEHIAAEKTEIVRRLGKSNTAILNFDNPLVRGMRSATKAAVVGFGESADAGVRLESVSGAWPKRLTCAVRTEGDGCFEISTQFVGAHWSTAVLGAVAVLRSIGMDGPKIAERLAQVEPFWGRLQPITLPKSGATVLRDEFNGSIDTFNAALEVLRGASAERKIVVFSDFSDTKMKPRVRAKHLGREAARVADVAIFVGAYATQSAESAMKEGMPDASVRAFSSCSHAGQFLKQILRRGDLVLLKGRSSHHLSRVYLSLLGDVSCELVACSRRVLCDRCPKLGFRWRPELAGIMASPKTFA